MNDDELILDTGGSDGTWRATSERQECDFTLEQKYPQPAIGAEIIIERHPDYPQMPEASLGKWIVKAINPDGSLKLGRFL